MNTGVPVLHRSLGQLRVRQTHAPHAPLLLHVLVPVVHPVSVQAWVSPVEQAVPAIGLTLILEVIALPAGTWARNINWIAAIVRVTLFSFGSRGDGFSAIQREMAMAQQDT